MIYIYTYIYICIRKHIKKQRSPDEMRGTVSQLPQLQLHPKFRAKDLTLQVLSGRAKLRTISWLVVKLPI